jgi:hypothetical protein
MKFDQLVCWSCGSTLAGVPMPISRISECLSCSRKLHACLMCEFHDPSVAQACREPIAEEVTDKQCANFCDYFSPRSDAFNQRNDPQDETMPSGLTALFGDSKKSPESDGLEDGERQAGGQELNDLFRSKD